MAAPDKSERKSAKTAASKAATKKAASSAKPAAKKTKPAAGINTKTNSAAKKSAAIKTGSMSAEERYRMTEVAAYFMAERNNFSGNPVEYWQAAEAQISSMLSQS
jgi:uncharacterized protein involved in outer membrane biogenesis